MYCEARVIRNITVSDDVMRMTFHAPEIAKECAPGQFVMLKAWEGDIPFLMRPFSINSADVQAGTIDLLYKIVGDGTRIMRKVGENDNVAVMGPLGHGFPIKENYKHIGIVGRGIGIAPMRFLVENAAQKGIDSHVYISGKNQNAIYDKEYFENQGATIFSSYDNDILITAQLEKELQSTLFSAVYTCGSKRLIRELFRLSKQYGFDAYASLEERMACGIGACKGCVCEATDESGEKKYAKVCQCGPVFPIERIIDNV